MHPYLTEAQQQQVVAALKQAIEQGGERKAESG
jgi:dTDP-4-amino-4,6-dideoxygalactose transaminase